MLSVWQVFKTNSKILMVGYATDSDIAFGIIGRNPKRKGEALFVWALNKGKPMHGLVHEMRNEFMNAREKKYFMNHGRLGNSSESDSWNNHYP